MPIHRIVPSGALVLPVEMAQLCMKLQRLFRECWPNASRYPDLAACRDVAGAVDFAKTLIKVPRKWSPPVALKHARLLLRHLPSVRRQHEAEADAYQMLGLQAVVDRQLAILETIKQTGHWAQTFLKDCAPAPPIPSPAFLIKERVQAAWANVAGGRVPKSVGPADPLCFFVASAMGLAGKPLSPETVSDLLRHRRRRRKKS